MDTYDKRVLLDITKQGGFTWLNDVQLLIIIIIIIIVTISFAIRQ